MAVAVVDNFKNNVNATLATFGSTSRQIDIQQQFATKLTDSINSGIGNLVDADLAKESARLQALQVKQQLGLQALSIANQAPQSVVSLFR
ncbi:flagellin [Hankyongella ginsenosidimutans]|uniref:flagellin n=1 Tax=Hankyongella ginsenosidimutans TaxID=1763828 RepID=UPI003CCC54DF